MDDKTTAVQVLRDRVKKFGADRDFAKYHSIKNLAIALSCEAAELLEVLLWQTDDSIAEQMRMDPVYRQKLLDELGDVMHVVLALTNYIEGCDLSTVFLEKMDKTEVKYKVEECYGSNKKC